MQPDSSPSIVDREPVLIVLGSAVALTAAVLGVANAFDWLSFSGDQSFAVAGFVGAIAAVAATILRANVYSPATFDEATNQREGS